MAYIFASKAIPKNFFTLSKSAFSSTDAGCSSVADDIIFGAYVEETGTLVTKGELSQ